jgi:hypothetical protein
VLAFQQDGKYFPAHIWQAVRCRKSWSTLGVKQVAESVAEDATMQWREEN